MAAASSASKAMPATNIRRRRKSRQEDHDREMGEV
jgi:hypothetical protein